MTDDELIGYTDLHSRTDVAEFSGESVNRLRVMAVLRPRTYGPKQYVVLDQADWLPLREMIMRRRELLAISKKLTRPELAWVAQMKGCYVIDSGAANDLARRLRVVLNQLVEFREYLPESEVEARRTYLAYAEAVGEAAQFFESVAKKPGEEALPTSSDGVSSSS